jgi:hypothetical protein
VFFFGFKQDFTVGSEETEAGFHCFKRQEREKS